MTDDTREAPAGKRAPRKHTRPKAQAANTHGPNQGADRSRTHVPPPGTPTMRPPASAPPRSLTVIPLHVRWRDLDAFNHVNNSAYLTFLEESRLEWLRSVRGEWFNAHAMPVMAAVELHYRKPITWPAAIDVRITCERLGESSVTLGSCIVGHNEPACVYADGNVVIVWVDPTTGASVPLPKAIREACGG